MGPFFPSNTEIEVQDITAISNYEDLIKQVCFPISRQDNTSYHIGLSWVGVLSLSLLPSIIFLFFSLNSHRQTLAGPQAEQLPGGLRIRPGFSSYEAYIERQLNKTLNPKLRKVWTTRDWDRKIRVFADFFAVLEQRGLLFNESKALCIGARVGQEVEALRRVGRLFSNVFDHALYPNKFVEEIERTLRPGGVCMLHVALSERSDKYSANDLYNMGALEALLRQSELIHVRTIDRFGLDTEVVFRKKKNIQGSRGF
ncbi:hypothetical protein NMG60_11030859 [Bertholletia excelsa]